MINFIRIVTFIVAVVITIISIFYIDAEKELVQAKQAYRAGDMDQTLRLARRANRAFSDNDKKVDAYFLQAKAAAQMDWDKTAKTYLDRLLSIEPENAGALLLRGKLNRQLGNNKLAVADIDKGLILASDNITMDARAYYRTQRGLAHLALKQTSKAYDDATIAINLSGKLPEVHDLMSKVFEEKGDIKKALDECKLAYKLSIEKDKLSFMTPEGQKLSDRLVELRGKYLLLK